jgi:hypothetical protein
MHYGRPLLLLPLSFVFQRDYDFHVDFASIAERVAR